MLGKPLSWICFFSLLKSSIWSSWSQWNRTNSSLLTCWQKQDPWIIRTLTSLVVYGFCGNTEWRASCFRPWSGTPVKQMNSTWSSIWAAELYMSRTKSASESIKNTCFILKRPVVSPRLAWCHCWRYSGYRFYPLLNCKFKGIFKKFCHNAGISSMLWL